MKYGSRIAQLREDRRLTQEELAGKMGITRAALSHYENNRRAPDYETILRLAEILQVGVAHLVGASDDPNAMSVKEVRDFANHLELSDKALLDKYPLTIDGKKLTLEETRRLLAFVRADRLINDN